MVDFLVGKSDASKSLLLVDTQRPLTVNLAAKLPIQKLEEFEVGNGKNFLHQKNNSIFRWSVKISVRVVVSRNAGGQEPLNAALLNWLDSREGKRPIKAFVETAH